MIPKFTENLSQKGLNVHAKHMTTVYNFTVHVKWTQIVLLCVMVSIMQST